MKRKIVWLGVSWLIVAAVVLASCGPAVLGEQEEEEEEIPTLSIGETYQTEEVAVTVLEAIVTDSYEYYHKASESMRTEEASPGTSFLIITVEINNVGSQTRRMEGALWFRALDSEDSRFRYQHAALFHGEDRLPYTPSLRSGEEMRGTVLFRIPEGASGLKIGYGIYVSYGPNIPLAQWEIE